MASQVSNGVEQDELAGLEQTSQQTGPFLPTQADRLVHSDLIVV